MKTAPSVLKSEIESTIQTVAQQTNNEDLTKVIAPIIFTNWRRNRIQRFLKEIAEGQTSDYVRRVFLYYVRWHEYVTAVQIEKREDVWLPLFEKLQRWAYKFLIRNHFPLDNTSPMQRQECAQEIATDAAVSIIKAHFPYDTDFDPWAAVVLQHKCRNYIKKHSPPPSAEPIELDQWDDWLTNLPDPNSGNDQQNVDLRSDLLSSMEHLTDSKKEFIQLYYFRKLSYKEIANHLNKNINALYKIHFDALSQLRKIWASYQDNNE